MLVRELKAEDFERIDPQPEQAHFMRVLNEAPELMDSLLLNGRAIEMDGEVLFVGGAIRVPGEDAAATWAVVSRSAHPFWREITRMTMEFFDALPYERLLGSVAEDFAAGHRWMKTLGFEPYGEPAEIGGARVTLYERVQ